MLRIYLSFTLPSFSSLICLNKMADTGGLWIDSYGFFIQQKKLKRDWYEYYVF